MIVVNDLETENHPWYGHVASPHNPENYVVETAWCGINDDGTRTDIRSVRFDNVEEANASNWMHEMLDGATVIVAHNAGYEIQWYLSRYRDAFEAFLKRGGRVLCTQMAEYLLSGFTHHYPALDEVAPKYGGSVKIDAVKLEWDAGKLTSEIDPAVLHEYLAGPEGDIANTYLAFVGQHAAMAEAGMLDAYYARCEALVAFAYCEFFGLFVDKEQAEANMRENEEAIAEAFGRLQKLLPDDLPEELEFSWSSRFHISALLFGGAIPYRKRVSYDPIKYVKEDCYEFGKGNFVPVADVDARGADEFERFGEITRFQRGKNAGLPKVFRRDTQEELLKWGDCVYHFKGVIDINRLPEVVRDNFAEGGEWTGAQKLRCGTPVYSTKEEVMDVLAVHGLEDAALLVEYARLNKELGTYYLRVEYDDDGNERKRSGMLQYVQEDGFVHHNLNLCATVTGRLSASRPNLQNLPRADEDDDGEAQSKVKTIFKSRFKGGRIVQVDYSALEVVMLAGLTGDTALLEHLRAGTDMHLYRLAGKLERPYEELLSIRRDPTHPEHASINRQRDEIKAPSFAAQYGASAAGIVYATGVSMEYAENFLATEAALFPTSIAYRDVIRAEVERTGDLMEGLRREQVGDGTWRVFKVGYWQSPAGNRYTFRQHEIWNHELRRRVMDYRPTQIANYWVQGEAFFLMAVAAGLVIRHLISNDFYGGKALLINNVHDALYLDCHPDVYVEAAMQVKALMEYAPVVMAETMGYDMLRNVPFPAEAVHGESMQEELKFDN